MNPNAKKYQLLTGNALKMIAIITMLIDHIGAALLEEGIIPLASTAVVGGASFNYTLNDYHTYITLDICFRIIGRIAFPIFLFLLVEGYLHTRDPFKYAFRLFIFALVSEIPFDLAFNGCTIGSGLPFELSYQNVFFTLTLSVLMFIGLEFSGDRINNHALSMLAKVAIVIVVMLAAEALKCDYSSLGIAMALFMYAFRNDRKQMMISFSVVLFAYCVLNAMSVGFSINSFMELFALLAFIPIAFYNGERGSFKLKYFFYVFYPAHLLILVGIRYLILK